MYNTVDIISNILQHLGYNVYNNLKKKTIPETSNIYFIYTFNEYEITNWCQINKIILWILL